MAYKIVASKKYEESVIVEAGKIFKDNIAFNFDNRYNYKLRIRGEVNIPYQNRTEDLYPIYFRKLEDSLVKNGASYTLVFNETNAAYERSCYYMITDISEIDKGYNLSVKVKAQGTEKNFKISAEVYYGDKRSRYYYEKPDEIYNIDICDSVDYKLYSKEIKFDRPVDFVMIKISAIDFCGQASVFAPKLTLEEKNFIDGFAYAPNKLGDQKWIGEGFSLTERPSFNVKLNGVEIFNGRKTDRLHRFAGVEFSIPDGLIKEENQFEITYLGENKVAYLISEMQLLTLPKELEILGVQRYQNKGKRFGMFCYTKNWDDLSVSNDKGIELIGKFEVSGGYGVLEFLPKEVGANQLITISDGENVRIAEVTVNEEKTDNVITGSGDFIYINQNFEDFCEYIAWYVNESIGDMLTLRSSYRWGGTAELDRDFWGKAVQVLKGLGLYYVLMIDGRELNGVNANPPKEILQSEYFLGEQTHERDGAFTYWTQDVSEYEALFYHLLSRKLERNGIYGKFSPVYDKKGNARIYYAGDDISDVKSAYESLVNNLKRTAADGATRHTGVTPLFSAFFDAGYKWLGYESMYGSHEIIFGALRGMSNSIGQNSFGAHLALQWSSVPCDDVSHMARYKLSLYESYMQGTTQINTEEGLWNIENPFEGFDRFSYACTEHRKVQQEFNRFVKAHSRKGRQVRKIAMMVGVYDGMDCFSTGRVYGQKRDYWEYSAPEYSWDLLKVFYPQAKIGAIYHFVKKGGNADLRAKDEKFLKAWPELYGGTALDYQSLGYYSATPYGVIDLISGDADNLSDYSFIFLTGWNSCNEAQLKKLCEYMRKGGILMLAKSHLFDSIDREEVFTGHGHVIESEYIETLLSYQKTGNLIYFDEEGYPIDFEQKYRKELEKAGAIFGSEIVKNSDRISFTEYEAENGARYIYALNICWWNETPATFSIKLTDKEFLVSVEDNDIKLIGVSPNLKNAVLIEGIDIDIDIMEDDSATLKGFGEAKVTLFNHKGVLTSKMRIEGVKKLDFSLI